MLGKKGLTKTYGSPNNQLRRNAFAFNEPNESVSGVQTFDHLMQHAVENLVHGKALGACGGEQSQPSHLVVQLIGTRAAGLENDHDHGYTERHAKQVVKRQPQKKYRRFRPERSIQAVQTTGKKHASEQFRAITFLFRT